MSQGEMRGPRMTYNRLNWSSGRIYECEYFQGIRELLGEQISIYLQCNLEIR